MNVFINIIKIQEIPSERCWRMAASQWSIKLDAKLQLHLKVWLCKDARELRMFFISPLKWVNSPMVMNFCLKWNSSNFWIAAYILHLPCTHWVNWGGSHLEKEVFRRLPVPVFLIVFTKTESITSGHWYYNELEGTISTSLMYIVYNESLGCLHAADKQPAAK